MCLQEKPGLSFYATDPASAVDSVRVLLSKAQNVVSRHLRPHTPLVLKATAGLRLLTDEQADAILQQVRYRFRRKFKVCLKILRAG